MTYGSARQTLPAALSSALASGASVVTPNNRLARRLVALHDNAQRGGGRTAWPAAIVLSWSAWQETLWQDVLVAEAPGAALHRVTDAQSAFLWRRIVALDAAHATPLVDARGAAALAADAWQLMHGWGAGGESWRGFDPNGEDETAFARWAAHYAATLARTSALDAARLADVLARHAPTVHAWRGRTIMLVGFIEFSPQQDRLLAALTAAGAAIGRCDALPAAPGRNVRATGATPRDEIARALAWARDRALADPAATIGIAIEDLAQRRDEVRALADDILCPGLQWPGREDAARPYNLSLGGALGDVGIVAAALDLIALAHAPLAMARAAALLRSPYLAGAETAWPRRAGAERGWLEEGQRELTLRDVAAALAKSDPALALRWHRATDALRLPARATPRAWVETWREWLVAAGWPGDRPLASAEYQARASFDELLTAFAALSGVEREMVRADALGTLRALAAEAVFQPEAPAAPIQILGVLEAAGMPFDALWVAGLAAERWPRPPQPNPLLPLAWQRERNVPRSGPARELAYAQALSVQLRHAAPDVVFSHAQSVDDRACEPSALIAALPLDESAPALRPTAHVLFAARPPRDALADDRAPPVTAGTAIRGGAYLIESQSDCPFKAVAAFRLRADPWPRAAVGLSFPERGSLVHAALAAFWRDVRTHAALVALAPAELDARIASAAAHAVATIDLARRRVLPPLVAAGESARIAGHVRQWLETFERARPPFAVRAVEADASLTLHGFTLALRLDRIDALADGGVAIIDYKTGSAVGPNRWFASRPEAPQLALYTLALRAAAPDVPVRAVVFAQLKPGEFNAKGLAADAEAWPGLASPAALGIAPLPDWAAVEAWWLRAMGDLAGEYAGGNAIVAPRDPKKTCNGCQRQTLCRIGARIDDRDEESADD